MSKKREPYVMPLAEIQALVGGFIQHGPIETYTRMKDKALVVMSKVQSLDEEFLDRSETLLDKARKEPEEEASAEEATLRDIYYTLSFMLRKLAHEIHLRYVKNNIKKESDRFLRVIYNKEAPKLLL